MRFPGFEGSWKERVFSDTGIFFKGKGISKEQLSTKGSPCILYGELYTKYKFEVITKVFSRTSLDVYGLVKSKANDVIIPSSGESASEIATACCVNIDGVLLGGDLNIIRPHTDNGEFISYQLNEKRKNEIAKLAQGSSVIHLYNNSLKKLRLYFPSLDEQLKISSLLMKINERISTQIKIIEDVKSLKESVLKNIFKREIRFKDHQGKYFSNWRERSLGDLTIFYNLRNKKNEKLAVYSINNKEGFVPQADQFEAVDSNLRGYDVSIYKVINKFTFAYNPARINVGSIGYSGDLNNILVSSLYVCFKTTEEVDDAFLFQYVKMDSFNKQVLEFMEGGVRSYLFYENFSKIVLSLPCLEEQVKIAKLLNTFDKKVNIEKELLDKMTRQKHFLINKLLI